MASAKHGLGRGLGALITSLNKGEEQVTPFTSGRSIVALDVSKISPNPRQPRKTFDDAKLEELTMSIKEQGITSPILVRRKGDLFELIAGERRLRAAKKAGFSTIPAIIKDFSDEQSLEITIVENLQREDLNPIEEAMAYKMLSEEFNLTHDQIAKKVGKDRSTVSNALRLLELPQKIIDSIAAGEITAGHARPLLGVEDSDHQIEVWREIVKKDLSVRDVEALLSIIAEKNPPTGGERRKKTKHTDIALKEIEDRIAEKLGTKIEIHGSSQKGRVQINYYSQEDLERIIEQICV
jgi:ParB family chromosome partitioning protein